MEIQISKDAFYSNSAMSLGMRPVELHGISKKSKSIRITSESAGGEARYLDANSWLPQAAEHYNISPNLNDYIIVPSPSCITEMPNTNGDSFSKQELLRFKPEHGCLAYRTFVGKPMHIEHDNKDYRKAVGVILDCYLRPLRKFHGNHGIMYKLNAIDRNRNPKLAEAILKREVNTFSMGAWYKSYTCSICGRRVGQNFGSVCNHTRIKKPTYLSVDGALVYRKCEDVTGFENSVVLSPAFVAAIGDQILMPE